MTGKNYKWKKKKENQIIWFLYIIFIKINHYGTFSKIKKKRLTYKIGNTRFWKKEKIKNYDRKLSTSNM